MSTHGSQYGALLREKGPRAPVLRETRYERVTSLLIALWMMAGLAVAGLLIVWLTGKVLVKPLVAVPVELFEIAGGEPGGTPGENVSVQGTEEAIGTGAPDAGAAEDEPGAAAALATVLDAAGDVPLDISEPQMEYGAAPGGKTGRVRGTGRAGRGVGGGPGSGIPREQRWLILYDQSQSLPEYARQLDSLKVELATIVGDHLLYVSELSQPKPSQRTGSAREETRLYWLWVGGERKRADVELFKKAGVQVGGGIIMQFYSREIEQTLAKLEREHAGREPKEIRRSSFGVRRTGDGYSFYVIDQEYY